MPYSNTTNVTSGSNSYFSVDSSFKAPTSNSSSLSTIFSDLAVQLYPTGRAFNAFKNNIKDKLHSAFNVSFIRFVEDSQLTLDSCFPDNINFKEDDCALWEYRFGMVSNLTLSLETRKSAIKRRMSRGKNILARQHIKYLEYQLQQAGFNVYVYENGFIESGVLVFKTPQQIIQSSLGTVQHSDDIQHGSTQHGGSSSQLIANSYLSNESFFIDDAKLSNTFFIGGSTLETFAEITSSRELEFRELVLKLKAAHLVAFTFINYV